MMTVHVDPCNSCYTKISGRKTGRVNVITASSSKETVMRGNLRY